MKNNRRKIRLVKHSSRRRAVSLVVLAGLLVTTIGCGGVSEPEPSRPWMDFTSGSNQIATDRDNDLVAALDKAVMDFLASPEDGSPSTIRNAVVHVAVPGRRFEHATAVGTANAGSDAPMTVGHHFHLASVAKVMTATLILQLWEEGRFGPKGLDVPLSDLGVFDPAVLDKLLLKDGVSHGPDLTLRRLLRHSTGMKDAQVDDGGGVAADYEGGIAPGSLIARFMAGVGPHMACLEDPGCDLGGLYTTRRWVAWDPSRPNDPEAGIVNYYLNHDGGSTASTAVYRPGAGENLPASVFLWPPAQRAGGRSAPGRRCRRICQPRH